MTADLSPDRAGIECRNCGCRHTTITHTYHHEYNFNGVTYTRNRRRRVCRYCGLSFLTVESYEEEGVKGKPEDLPTTPSADVISPPEKSTVDRPSANPYL